jgi:hypothetical protein
MEEVGTWRTASYSATNGNCVEVADAPGSIAVRDTVNRAGTVIEFTASAWKAFAASLK